MRSNETKMQIGMQVWYGTAHRLPLTTTRFIFGIFSLPSAPSPAVIPFFFASFSASISLLNAEAATPVGAIGE